MAPASARRSDGASERRGWLKLQYLLKELATAALDRGHHQRPVEKIILLFTTGLCNQQASMAGRAMQVSVFVRIIGLVLRAYRIVGAQQAEIERIAHRLLD